MTMTDTHAHDAGARGDAGHALPPAATPVPLPETHDWKRFDVSPERGFLPDPDPATSLPAPAAAWDHVARDLPKLLLAGRLERALGALPELPLAALEDERALRRAMCVLSYLGHGWVWGQGERARDRIPAAIARPWYAVAAQLGRPPVLSYASYALDNWRRLAPSGPISLENIAIVQSFLGGADEDWFIAVHVHIEAEAGPLLAAIPRAQRAAAALDAAGLEAALAPVSEALERIVRTLLRMPEHCDPYIYFHRVRPYIHGFKDQPALPDGVIYEGVDAFGPRPQRFRGETGAQSGVVPVLDALLGVTHADDPLRVYLREMRGYMPPKHRAFLEAVEAGPSVRDAVVKLAAGAASLVELYEDCLHWLEQLRAIHLDYAARYIYRQARTSSTNPNDVGTGGTPFMRYLAKHRDETARHRDLTLTPLAHGAPDVEAGEPPA
jgi:indoleamine 2,3-dioxygenase